MANNFLLIPLNPNQQRWLAEQMNMPDGTLPTGADLRDWLVAGNSLEGLPSGNRVGRPKKPVVDKLK